jgi:fatty-acyl-CoA synthase
MNYMSRILDGIDDGATVLVGGGHRLIGTEVRRLVAGLTQALAEVGLRPGAGVACLHGSTPESVLTRLAVQALGCYYIGLRPMVALSKQAEVLVAAKPAAFLFDPAYERHAIELLTRVPMRLVLSLGPVAFGRDLLELAAQQDLAARQAGQPWCCLNQPEDLAVVNFTSGTTGQPKGVGRSFAAMSACLDAALSMYGAPPWRFLVVLPLSYLGGELAQWTLAGGGTIVLHEGFDLHTALATIEHEQITHLFITPGMLYQLAEQPMVQQTDLSSLQQVIYGGAPPSPARTASAVERLGAIVVQNYGTQEAGFVAALGAADHLRSDLLSSAGRPLPTVDVQIRNGAGTALPVGSVGEIWLRSPMVMNGYWRDPQRTAEVLCKGWLRTGDLGRVDERGYLYLVDRIQDMIIVEGYNVYLQQIQHVLLAHPGVCRVVVVGVPDPDWGEAVCAAVVRGNGVKTDAEELRALVLERLGALHVPRHVEFVYAIPTTPSGKLDKSAVRAWFAGAGQRAGLAETTNG